MKHTQNLTVNLDDAPYTLSYVGIPKARNLVPKPHYHFGAVQWNEVQQKLVLPLTKAKYQVVGSLCSPNTGEHCECNTSCVPIRPVQAKCNALKTLKKSDMGKLEIRTQAVASELMPDPQAKEIRCVVCKKYVNDDALLPLLIVR